jgi:hypothetical protein
MPFISFSCLPSVAETSDSILKRICESRDHCPVPNLKGKLFKFQFEMILDISLLYEAFIVLQYIPSATLSIWFIPQSVCILKACSPVWQH